ncbi:uncharacterized protein [Dermacentor andersoni]|uniref:uncharacterized protein isoform X2 n=1 Tax=Dermacentor andersoni TaxID=34620 RepID=UPI002416DCD1|nr:uncharacterized protein LOC126547754 isoform X3 [Dermacentor andersoni]
MIYPLLILAALLALSCSETDQLKPPEPCEDKACVEYCMKVLGGPEFNVTGKCVKNETGAQSCSCRRRTYCTVEACARSCYAYHGGKPNLRSECEKYLCRCIWDDHTTGSKRSRLHRRSAPDRSMRQKRQAAPVKKERPKCSERECSTYCGRKYYHQRPVSGRCEGFDCICSWFVGYSMHKHPLPPYT